MAELIERHLEEIGARMGRFLRGFNDPMVHLGAPEQFAREFRKVLALPMLRRPDEAAPISYADAVSGAHVSGIDAQSADSVGVLLQGLAGPATQSTESRVELSPATVANDLSEILREPMLHLYVQAVDQNRLLSAARSLAAQEGYSIAIADGDAMPACQRCGAPLHRVDAAAPFACPRCRKRFETIEFLPMPAAIGGVFSFDFLRALVALDEVATYQESGDIRPTGAFEGN